MDLLNEINRELAKVADKLNQQKSLETEDFEILFLKSLIEEETGHGTRTKE